MTRLTISLVAGCCMLLGPGPAPGQDRAREQVAPPGAAVLREAREEVRLSRLTLDRIREAVIAQLQQRDLDPAVLEDYLVYYEKVQQLTVAHERMLEQMEAINLDPTLAPPDGGSIAERSQIDSQVYDPPAPRHVDPVEALDRELDEALSDFDDYLLAEQYEAARRMEQLDEASSEEMTELAREAAAAVERLRDKGIDVETGSPGETGSEGEGQESGDAGEPGGAGGQPGQPGQPGQSGGSGGSAGGSGGSPGANGSQTGDGAAGGGAAGDGGSAGPPPGSVGPGGSNEGDPGADGGGDGSGGSGASGEPGTAQGTGSGGTGGDGTTGSPGQGQGGTSQGSAGGGGGGASGSGQPGTTPPTAPPGSQTGGGDDKPPVGTGDRPPADDDDIVARQLREAAEKETDPVLKEKLWQEYERYKQSS